MELTSTQSALHTILTLDGMNIPEKRLDVTSRANLWWLRWALDPTAPQNIEDDSEVVTHPMADTALAMVKTLLRSAFVREGALVGAMARAEGCIAHLPHWATFVRLDVEGKNLIALRDDGPEDSLWQSRFDVF